MQNSAAATHSHEGAPDSAAPSAPVVPPTAKLAMLMPRVASLSSDIRTLTFNLFVLLLVGLLAPVVLGQFWRSEVVVEPIAVPAQLQVMGLTPEVASARLVDALRAVDEAGGSAIESIDVVASTDRVDFSIPDSGLSIDSLVYYVRRFFNIEETRIGGEFRCADPDCSLAGVSLRLRVFSGEAQVIQVEPMQSADEEAYFYEAALRVMEQFQPIVALAAIVDDQPLKAEVMARRIIREQTADAHWAHNLLGSIKINAGELHLAAEEFSAALSLAPRFVPAKANLANTWLLLGDAERAQGLFEQVRRSEPDNVRALEGLGDLARNAGKSEEALKLYREATRLDPTSTRYLVKAAQMLLADGDEQAGRRLLEEALQIDPSDPGALAQLGLLHFMAGDYAGAVPFYRNAADYAATDAALHHEAGLAMLLSEDPAGAAERFGKATALAPDTALYLKDLAAALSAIERHTEARSAVDKAAALEPDNAAIAYQQAIVLQKLGETAGAVAAYKRVIELDPDSTEATVARRFIEVLSPAQPDAAPAPTADAAD